jgi:DNA-3-methyladenine glycosylase
MTSKFNRDFYRQDIKDLAKALLGSTLVRLLNSGEKLSGKIVEVEIYTQKDDPSSHSYKGKTSRNAVMFGPPGHLYVYFTYGMHFCSNIVCGPEGRGDAILIRALEPQNGIDIMIKQRFDANDKEKIPYRNLTNGPAKLCRAFGIDMTMNGADLCGEEVWIEQGEGLEEEKIGISTRIGITRAKDQFKRYYIKGNPWVSKTGKGIKHRD